MNTATESPIIIGSAFGGGFYAGGILIDGAPHALIVAPKADGEHKDTRWNKSAKTVDGARSYFDGMANTKAMAAAGSKLAQWALDLHIDGNDDWYLPSQDELEILYRNLKPSTGQNYLYGRSGINVSAMPPTHPYLSDLPAQTAATSFQAGAEQAFDEVWYWSSTQHASDSDCAWGQHFYDGYQDGYDKSFEGRARAVRRLAI
jgi:hypothetical protein